MDIHFIERSESVARIRIDGSPEDYIQGTIRGPFCRYARTLATTHNIDNGQTVIVDPCYWTAALPFRYEVRLIVSRADGSVQNIEFLWGLRSCIPHGSDLRLNSHRHVVRAVGPRECSQDDLAELHSLSAALHVLNHDDAVDSSIYEEASERGVLLIVSASRALDMRELSRYPAVHFVDAPIQRRGSADVLTVSRTADSRANVILLDEREASESPRSVLARPVFVQRVIKPCNLADMRAACDQLQRDMARHGQYAGYLVSAKA